MNGSLKSRNRRPQRAGVAAAEFAVCLPVIVLIVLATIEACTMVFLKQSLNIAAYEGARTALAQNVSSVDVVNAAEQVLTERNVNGGTVTISPSNLGAIAPGQYLTVSASAPATGNSVIPIRFYRGRTLTGSATMMKEFQTSSP
ncbi:MAG: TadE/TadG family type IV pilus assembly protein [Bythopirellula sp.]|nr:TadE/TadG family type IV pilus assembly protein [Bythopirellula sp.]